MKIREIKYPRMFKFYIGSNTNSKTSRFAKLSTYKDGSNLQFAKLSPRKIKVFYSITLMTLQWSGWHASEGFFGIIYQMTDSPT